MANATILQEKAQVMGTALPDLTDLEEKTHEGPLKKTDGDVSFWRAHPLFHHD